MAREAILTEVRGNVAFVTLNRPDVLNSFDRAMARELQGVLDGHAAHADVRALVLTGAGRAFCAGQDLVEVVPPDGSKGPDVAEVVAESYNPLVLRLAALEKPVVCAVNGVAAGAGANLALACDFVLAAKNASFIQSFVNIGLVPDSGGTFFLPRLVGLARAKTLTMLGDRLSAEQALAFGLLHAVHEPDKLMAEAEALAVRLAAMPTLALGLTKRALHASLDATLEKQLELERALQGVASKSHDYREGVKAFQEKRKPKFTGR
ncbi:MAG TPA: enoyl-CoA hydratase-related protein [Myxococcota bacterium]|nr:enoyl-CoA hydratase-related protein [Myxococcota bacterium]